MAAMILKQGFDLVSGKDRWTLLDTPSAILIDDDTVVAEDGTRPASLATTVLGSFPNIAQGAIEAQSKWGCGFLLVLAKDETPDEDDLDNVLNALGLKWYCHVL